MTTFFLGFRPVLAFSWWGWLGYLSNVSSRGSVITLCIVIVCMSLVIVIGAARR